MNPDESETFTLHSSSFRLAFQRRRVNRRFAFRSYEMMRLHMPLHAMLRLLTAGLLSAFCLSTPALAAKKHTLLVVFTHGDDVTAIAPLLAKSSAEGHAVYYAIFPGVQAADEGGKELNCGARALGVKETFSMRGPAGDNNVTAKAVAERLIEIINGTKPDVIVTWGPDGVTGHGRHILVGNVVTRLFQQQLLLKHKPRKLYYVAYPESRFPEKRLPFGEIADVNGPFGTVSDALITTKVDGSRYLKQAREAIACFTSTLENNEVWQRTWSERIATTLSGTVFLRLVMPATGGRETDIFKGL
jgi:LmbE family N-acetylglucosaminyl deacetylase